MKKTLNIDAKLLAAARDACGASTDTETVRLGLEKLCQHRAYQEIRKFIGSEPDAELTMPPRHREPPRLRARARQAGQ